MNDSEYLPIDKGNECSSLDCNFVATAYLASSAIYIFLYIPCTFFIISDINMINQPYYRIVIHMGVLDLLTLILNGMYSSILTYLKVDSATDYTTFMVNKIIGGFMNAVGVTNILFAHLLSFNRFMAICFPNQAAVLFSLKNTKKILWLCWTYHFGWYISYLMPGLNIVYSLETFSWDYDMNHVSRLACGIEFIVDMTNVAFMVFWYICISIVLKLKTSAILLDQENRRRKRELKVLLQAFIVCALVILMVAGFFIIPQVYDSKWACFAANCLWLSCAGLNSVIYMCFNSTLRRKALDMMKWQQKNSIGIVFTNNPNRVTVS